MITYKIITHDNLVGLEAAINAALAEGWMLQGGVSVTNYVTSEGVLLFDYHQAITKVEYTPEDIKKAKETLKQGYSFPLTTSSGLPVGWLEEAP
jgi:hypothetical protein